MKRFWIVLLALALMPCMVQAGTLNLQCVKSSEDAGERAGTTAMYLTGAVRLSGASAGWQNHGGLRFAGVSGIGGATINSATLTFVAYDTRSGDFIGDWYAHDAAAPDTFSTAAYNISTRTRTTATCEGDGVDFGDWTAGNTYTFTGDGVNTITGIIQEVATDYNPSSIAMLWIFSSGTNLRQLESVDTTPSKAAKLDITYTAAATGPANITSVAGTGTITGWSGTSWSALTKWCRP